MSGAQSRRKGADFERTLVRHFREAMPAATVRRGLQFRSGEEVADVDLPRFFLEAKHHRRTNIREAMRQASEACPPERWPLAVCKDDHEPALATMRLADFLDLVREWWGGRLT